MKAQLIESPKLVCLALVFTMEGEAWGGFTATQDVSIDFMPPRDPNGKLPWCIEWEGLREALLHATNWGDVVGNMGEIVDGYLEWRLVNRHGHHQTLTKPLEEMRGAADFMAKAA